MNKLSPQQISDEFDRQTQNLVAKGYPKVANLTPEEFLKHLLPLKDKLKNLEVLEADFEKGFLPFVIVTKSELLDSEKAMNLVEKDGKQGVTILRPHTSRDFKTITDIELPSGMAYLLVGIDRGKENINLPPNKAMEIIKKEGKSPLTIDEGIAIVTHFPQYLIKNNCFSLLGSRTGSDKRVPAIWINAKKQPNLGWCWDGNPHTWLGSASAEKRFGV